MRLFIKKTLFQLSILLLVIVILHLLSLKPIFELSLHGDDWKVRSWSKLLGSNHVINVINIFKSGGYSYLYQLYHVYILESIWGFNIPAFHLTNIFIKSLAALSLYITIFIIFRNQVLALFTTLFYTTGYTVSAPLEWVLLGGDYWAVIMINIFLIVYYKAFQAKQRKWYWILVLPIPYYVTMFFSPFRAYPLLLLPITIELLVTINKRSMIAAMDSIKRLSVLYLPILLATRSMPIGGELINLSQSNPAFFSIIEQGNWHHAGIFLTGFGLPVAPLLFITRIFGEIHMVTFLDYFGGVLRGTITVFMPLTLFLAFGISSKRIRFFITVILSNLILDLLLYILYVHSFIQNPSLKLFIDLAIYPSFVGIYVLVFACVSFKRWLLEAKHKASYLTIWVGPIFTMVFMIGIILVAGQGTFSEIHRYLSISSIGIYFFMSAVLALMYKRVRSFKNSDWTFLIHAFFILLFFLYFQASTAKIADYFDGRIKNGRSYKENSSMYDQMNAYLNKYGYNISVPSLFIFDLSDDPENGQFYEQGFEPSFLYWVHMKDSQYTEGCVGMMIWDIRNPGPKVIYKDSQKGLVHNAFCQYRNQQIGRDVSKEMFFPANSIYAFKLQNRSIIDNRDQALKDLGI